MKKFDSVEDLKADWKRIDHALIPHDLLVSMPQPECKGLTMLTDVMINATVCKLGPCIGQITAPYSDDIEIVLDVAGTIERRMPRRQWMIMSDDQRMRDRHLETRVRNSKTGVTAKVCIVAMGISVPAIDDCVAFVLWAEAGFPYPPYTLDDKILYVRDPEFYERNQAIQREEHLWRERNKNLRRELRLEESLASSKAMLDIHLERQRIHKLGWHELIREHESTGPPADAVSVALYDLRIHLLSLPAPGHTIGHTLERRESKEDSK